ncbi:hypothetical protein N1031_14710 [Herbiconiux moechotypicola]|uniref:Glycosyltransferase RgtA/B/C/D-like domain-containing protein n=1 Tax=Herbiconiux moechotypicola TaxID=637393 RepID=A0ABN3DV69_9MICO|nr:hypothetical protein [Herbiconiux moechotypicola]MCS5731015.1 hypothetical protein [Herbiconiux moechotypicola]
MELLSVLVALAAICVPLGLVAVASTSLSRVLWRAVPEAAPLFGVLGLAAASWLVFLGTWAAPAAGVIVAAVLLAGSLVVCLRSHLLELLRGALPLAGLLASAVLLSLGFAYLWGGSGPYDVIAERFFAFRLPIDNTIPSLFADRLSSGESTHALLGDWNGGDRPPLQSGLELLLRPLTLLGGMLVGAPAGAAAPEVVSFAADLAAQLLWVPAAFALLRLLRVPRGFALGAVAFALLLPSVAVNTVFTWPKLLSAALVLVSLGLVVAARHDPRRFVVLFALAVASAVLALLAHGAAAFAAPVLLVVGVSALRGRGMRTAVASMAWGAGAGLVLYLPWAVFQRVVDPPGDRLLKWHLAGVQEVDARPFVEALADRYAALTPSEAIATRLQNLSTVFGSDQFERLADGRFDLLTFLRVEDYTSTMVALGLVGAPLALVMAAVLATRWRSLDEPGRLTAQIVFGCFASILLWALVLFTPYSAIVAHGSHVWILLLAVLPFGWLLQRRPRLGCALLGVQAAVFLAVYWVPLLAPPGPLSRVALVVALAGAAGVLAVAVVMIRRESRPGVPAGVSEPLRAASGASSRT